ncbi:transcriptional regulator, TetR family [Sphingomonas laterariae]|uniref:Transcriptional regulator, TetR family n=1 Tax=Edaphosphingomonas laterariae TaxID=861865 RepID=A0A239DFG6_9SPHN|nr:TetR/AcrR family transcriptional regulator [Sphingomonas laterariae]SNS30574.1 transcriptional regulator, TetR family [Sphingomonas laterariae]
MAKVNPASKRGRPTKAQVAEINRAITAAAVGLFLEEGYSATAMETVAARAGVSKVTVYSRFATKADLFAAVVADRVAAWSVEAGKADVHLPKTPRGRLEHHALVMVESLAHPEVAAFSRLIVAEQRRFPELARIYREGAFAVELDLLTREIAAIGQERGHQVADANAVALTLVQALTGWANLQSLFEEATGPDERRAVVRRTIDLLVDGVAAW